MTLEFRENEITNVSPWEIVGSSKTRLVHCTPNIDQSCAFTARVSSQTQGNPSVSGLLKYCIKHNHWSIFEQGSLTIEVVTPLAIAIQLLRHRSFCFQQFSGRYQDQKAMTLMTDGLPTAEHDLFYMTPAARMQDTTNRQNSIKCDDEQVTALMQGAINDAILAAYKSYNKLLDLGIAKEVARFVLPQNTYTRLYVTGSPRSFIHYCSVRDDEGVAQWEHVELARSIAEVFTEECPIIAEAVWG